MAIPRIFHRIWLGDEPMSDEFRRFGETWQRLHPDWEMILWTEATFPPLKNNWAYMKTSSLAGKSDIARYEILSQYGGIYVDTDFECLKNLEPLLYEIECFVVRERENLAQNAIIGAVPSHPFLSDLVDSLEENVRNKSHISTPVEQTGPQYLTHILERHPEVTVYSTSLFFPYQWHERWRRFEEFQDAYAVHHWSLSWRARPDSVWKEESSNSLPCLSVVIRTCDDGSRLEWVLEGLRMQTVNDFEVIVVGRYNTSIERLIQRFKNQLDISYRYRRSRRKMLRPAEVRNHGLRYAQAPRTLFLDGDCLPDTDLMETHASFGATGYVPFGFRRIYPSEKFYPFRAPVDYSGLCMHSCPDPRRAFPYSPFNGDWRDLSGFCFSAPTQALRELGGFDESLTCEDDQDMARRLVQQKYRLIPVWNNGYVTQLDHAVIRSRNPK